MPSAPARLTACGLKRLSCQSRLAKNASGSSYAFAATTTALQSCSSELCSAECLSGSKRAALAAPGWLNSSAPCNRGPLSTAAVVWSTVMGDSAGRSPCQTSVSVVECVGNSLCADALSESNTSGAMIPNERKAAVISTLIYDKHLNARRGCPGGAPTSKLC